MLIDMIIFRAAMVRRSTGNDFEARPRDFVRVGDADDTLATADRIPSANVSTNR